MKLIKIMAAIWAISVVLFFCYSPAVIETNMYGKFNRNPGWNSVLSYPVRSQITIDFPRTCLASMFFVIPAIGCFLFSRQISEWFSNHHKKIYATLLFVVLSVFALVAFKMYDNQKSVKKFDWSTAEVINEPIK